MQERNDFLEMDGLYWESETHEWFHDKGSTHYAQTDRLNNDALPNIFCFVVRNKQTGGYDRVVMDKESNSIVFESKELEQIGGFIDRLKIIKRYE